MQVEANLISGMMLGVEYVEDEFLGNCLVLDVFIIRIVFFWN